MPSSIQAEDFTDNLFALLQETFESPPNPRSIFLDQKSGLFETLAGISTDQAFRPISQGKTSVASQVNHITHYLLMMESFMLGHPQEPDWQKTWQLKEATPEVWTALKTDLETVYRRLLERLRQVTRWGEDEIGDGMAMVAHSAYHLGAIRQIMQVAPLGTG